MSCLYKVYKNVFTPKTHIDDVITDCEVVHDDQVIENQRFRFTVDTNDEVWPDWLYDLRIGEGNSSRFMPQSWVAYIQQLVDKGMRS